MYCVYIPRLPITDFLRNNNNNNNLSVMGKHVELVP